MGLTSQAVSIPLEQGNVLRHQVDVTLWLEDESQSLWNRAMSYDSLEVIQMTEKINESQSLWNRAMSYDCSGVLEPCGTRLARATSQLFPRLR